MGVQRIVSLCHPTSSRVMGLIMAYIIVDSSAVPTSKFHDGTAQYSSLGSGCGCPNPKSVGV